MNPKISQKSLLFRFKKNLLSSELLQTGDRVLVAVSGGPDSMVLLDLLNSLKESLKIEIAVVHYNHRQRGGEADREQKFVEKISASRGLRCFVGVHPKKEKLSENDARNARYKFFEKVLGEWQGDKIAVAHTLNDQAETILLRLIRGAGILGLSGIPLQRQKIIRPLLTFSRQEVLKYLEHRQLTFCHDSSNDSTEFDRNKIRKNVLPELIIINNQAIKNIVSSSLLLAQQQQLLTELLTKQYQKVLLSEKSTGIRLSLEKLLDLSPILRRELIKIAIDKLSLIKDLTIVQLDAIDRMINKKVGRKYISPNPNLQICLEKGIIRVLKLTRKKDE